MNAVGLLIGFGVLTAVAVAALGPLYCAYLLVRHFLRGTPLPKSGIYGLYLGGFPWTFVVFYQGALHPTLKILLPLPFFACGILAATWARRQDPPRSYLSAAGDALTLTFLGLMSIVTCGGGMYDKMITMSLASSRLKDAHISAEDPAALTRALDDPDPLVKWGAAMALQRFGPDDVRAREGLTKALLSDDPRVSQQAARSFFSETYTPAPAVLGPLLDSKDPALRARTEKALESLGPPAKSAALSAVARWRTETSSGAAVAPPPR